MAFRVGDTIGDYRIESVLGEGGMGQVFRVRNLLSDRVEAMKIVIPGLEGREHLPERFLREIRVLASLDHPHIVTMRTALRVEDRVALVMEYVDGVSLYTRLRAEGVATANVLRYIGQVLSALAYAHAHGVVHRDIKPDNILVTGGGIAKLTDFGVAQFKGDQALTSTGAAVGSLHYMSPEQVRGTDVDGRSDIYSVGITLYELTTGRRAIRGDSNWAIMDGHLNQRPTPPVEVNPNLSHSLSEAILRSIEKKPADRFQTADEFRMALGDDTVTIAHLPNAFAHVVPSTPTPSPVDAAQLAKVEKHLVTAVGPIGKQLVARAARSNTPLPELCRELAAQIPTPREREDFLRNVARELTPPSPVPGQAATIATPAVSGDGQRGLRTPVPALDPAITRAAKQKLATVLGPIAGILVDKAARTARSPRELYEALAAQIPTESERQTFLKSAPR
jgi:eukaryotic-like serine/threonine-protein kinase